MESLEIEVKYFNYPETPTYKSFPVQVFQKDSNPLLALRIKQPLRVQPGSHLCQSSKESFSSCKSLPGAGPEHLSRTEARLF